MQEFRANGDEYLSGPKSVEDSLTALNDKGNRAVMMHKPGSTVTMPSGTQYKVRDDGSWERLRP